MTTLDWLTRLNHLKKMREQQLNGLRRINMEHDSCAGLDVVADVLEELIRRQGAPSGVNVRDLCYKLCLLTDERNEVLLIEQTILSSRYKWYYAKAPEDRHYTNVTSVIKYLLNTLDDYLLADRGVNDRILNEGWHLHIIDKVNEVLYKYAEKSTTERFNINDLRHVKFLINHNLSKATIVRLD